MPRSYSPTNRTSRFIFNAGFVNASFADTHLVLRRPVTATTTTTATQTPPLPAYGLHALLAARSPVLYARLTARPGPPYEIELDASDENLTTDGVNVALGSLYSGRTTVPDPRLAVGILAAALLFGLDGLRDSAWQACLSRWRSDDGLIEGIRFILDQQARDELHGTQSQGKFDISPAPGLAMPPQTTPGMSRSSSGTTSEISQQQQHNGHHHRSPYTKFIGPLLPELLEKLTRKLPSAEHEEVLVTLPFNLVKGVLESPLLGDKLPSMMARNDFARRIVARRRTKLNEPGVEESVVMAFGGDSGAPGGGVEVIRRERGTHRKKQLWKAGR